MPDLRTLLAGPVDQVAPRLLGAVLAHDGVVVRITEVEAYGGADDPGSHAHRGRTRRNAVMFGPAGVLYTYLSYGLHVCANVSTGVDGEPAAVLLRAGAVVDGLDVAGTRRPGVSGDRMARGPALLTRTLAIGLEHDGTDLCAGPVTLTPSAPLDGWSAGPRVGLRGAPERPWRFWITGDPTVSAYRRHPRLAPPPTGC